MGGWFCLSNSIFFSKKNSIEPYIWVFNISNLLHFYAVLFVHKFKNCLTQVRRGEGFWQKILVWLRFVFIFFILKKLFWQLTTGTSKILPLPGSLEALMYIDHASFLFCFFKYMYKFCIQQYAQNSYIDLAKMQFDISEILYKYIFKFIYLNKLWNVFVIF